MSLSQLFQLIKSLPPVLQERVAAFAEGLKEGEQMAAHASASGPTIRWAEQPDLSALVGLTQEQPLDLPSIRRKAWRR